MTREYNIKEKGFRPIYKGIPPFMRYEKGFGYLGVMLEDEVTGELQCHICGRTAKNIAKHIYHNHKQITVTEYRRDVGINEGTPLMSENTRKKHKNNFLNLTEDKKNALIERLRNNNKVVKIKGKSSKRKIRSSIEYNNKYGTCPEQAKALFWEEYTKLGRIPTNSEMSHKLRWLVYDRFGGYKNALIAWGISESEYREYVANKNIKSYEARREHNFFPKFTEEEVRQKYSDFFFANKRMPTWGEVAQYGLPGRVPFERVFKMSKSSAERMMGSNIKNIMLKGK